MHCPACALAVHTSFFMLGWEFGSGLIFIFRWLAQRYGVLNCALQQMLQKIRQEGGWLLRDEKPQKGFLSLPSFSFWLVSYLPFFELVWPSCNSRSSTFMYSFFPTITCLITLDIECWMFVTVRQFSKQCFLWQSPDFSWGKSCM